MCMRQRNLLLTVFGLAFAAGFGLVSAQGPGPSSSETVAKPRKKSGGTEAPAEKKEQKVESKFKKKDTLPEGGPTFKSDVTTVSVDVSVLDKNGRFIPNIPRGNFRLLEDGSPQKIGALQMGEAPM